VTSARNRKAGVALATLGVVLALATFALPGTRPTSIFTDFNAFYCAGAAIDRGDDPYRIEPLASCERAPRADFLSRAAPNLAIPAPLPPYALAPFALLSRLPYAVAGSIWLLLLLGALGATISALWRLTRLPLPAVIAAVALGDGYAAIVLGQIAPFAIAAIALACLWIERGFYLRAACAAAIAMLEPHVGLPGCLALFFWAPRTRLPLAALGVAFCAVSLWIGGTALNLEYLQAVLPSHALSEVVNEKQYSLTYVLGRFGLNDTLALRLGDISYALMTTLGIALAPLLAKRAGSRAFLVALPSATALLGGPFVHIIQMPAAIPCALLLYARLPAQRPVLLCALLALAVPWVQFTMLGSGFPLLAAVTCGILVAALGRSRLAVGLAGVVAYAFVVLTNSLIVTFVPDPSAALAAHFDPHALAQANWALYVRLVGTTDLAAYDLAKLPTWAGLCTLAVVAAASVFRLERKDFAGLRQGNVSAARIAVR
jgi:Glycosyltransferase family 87